MKELDPQLAATKVAQVGERVKKLKERVEKGKKARDDKKPVAIKLPPARKTRSSSVYLLMPSALATPAPYAGSALVQFAI